MGWLWRIIFGRFGACAHEWETESKGEITRVADKACIGWIYVLRCKKCGEIERRRAA